MRNLAKPLSIYLALPLTLYVRLELWPGGRHGAPRFTTHALFRLWGGLNIADSAQHGEDGPVHGGRRREQSGWLR